MPLHYSCLAGQFAPYSQGTGGGGERGKEKKVGGAIKEERREKRKNLKDTAHASSSLHFAEQTPSFKKEEEKGKGKKEKRRREKTKEERRRRRERAKMYSYFPFGTTGVCPPKGEGRRGREERGKNPHRKKG